MKIKVSKKYFSKLKIMSKSSIPVLKPLKEFLLEALFNLYAGDFIFSPFPNLPRVFLSKNRLERKNQEITKKLFMNGIAPALKTLI